VKQLLYGILRVTALPCGALPGGPEDRPLRFVCHRGLAAACAPVDGLNGAPTAAEVLAFARVVQSLHERTGALPVRYGCLLHSDHDICEFLRPREKAFLAMLDALDGCVEMGLRVLLHETAPDLTRVGGSACDDCRPGAAVPRGPGAVYLLGRRAQLARKDALDQRGEAVAEQMRQLFRAVTIRSRSEMAITPKGEMLSLCFLISRDNCERFRAVFHTAKRSGRHDLLMTGPWPPYSFVGDCPN
jgi:hypothetical protein